MPTINDTDPDSPADDNNPEVKGSAEAGSTVRIYSTPDCAGTPVATGGRDQFDSPGITTNVPGDQTTDLRATATDRAGNTSTCSTPVAYAEDSTGPATSITEAPPRRTTKRNVKFAFSSSEAGSTFRCSFEEKPVVSCLSPWKRTVKPGRHTFEVHAVDRSGNGGAPIKTRFKVIK
jgi:hypothetical protein